MRKKPLELQLPIRPLLNIQNITLQGQFPPQMKALSKLRFSLEESQLNHFTLLGDINAEVVLTNAALKANIALLSPAITALLPEQINVARGDAELTYFGDTILIRSDLEIAAQLTHDLCLLDVQSDGYAELTVDLNSQQLRADVSKLNNHIIPTNCMALLPAQYHDILSQSVLQSWQVMLPAPISIHKQQVVTEQLRFQSEDNTTQLSMDEISFVPAAVVLNGQLTASHSSGRFGVLSLEGPFNLSKQQLTGDVSFQYETDLAQINPSSEQRHILSSLLSVDATGGLLRGEIGYDVAQSRAKVEMDIQGSAKQLHYQGVKARDLELTIQGSTELDKTMAINTSVTVNAPLIEYQSVQAQGSTVRLDVDLTANQQLNLTATLSNRQLLHSQVRLSGSEANWSLSGNVGKGEIFADISGTTHLGQLKRQDLVIKDIVITSRGKQSRTGLYTHHISSMGADAVLKHQYLGHSHPFQFVAHAPALTSLQPIVDPYAPEFRLVAGDVAIEAEGDLNILAADFGVQLNHVSALYDSHYVDGVNTRIQGQYNSGNINVAGSKVTIGQIRSGVIFTDIETWLHVEPSQAYLDNLSASVFAGQVKADRVNLSGLPQEIRVLADNLDLGLISHAGREAGIELEGKVSGHFPVHVQEGQVSMSEGVLLNTSEGKLKVAQNASIEALKSQQPSLESVIGVLDDLTIDSLRSDVALAPDGVLTLGVKIVGENKQQAQPVNFNYTHQENIFPLFRMLRLSDDITKRVEEALTKQEQSP